MWHVLEKITEQVQKYSTFLGQLWYILVFIFRLIVVVTIGGSVYGDEQSAFKCSTAVVGCQNVCYNEFAKMSHIRFWAFQLLAVIAPTVFFHSYTLYVNGEIHKLKNAEARLKAVEEGDAPSLLAANEKTDKDFRVMSRRRKSIGNIKTRQIYSGNELKDVTYTNKIHYAYYLNIILRMSIEALFIYFGYQLFSNMDYNCKHNPSNHFCSQSHNPFYFLWFKVPARYDCQGVKGSDVYSACYMHVEFHGGYVPCFVSRPYEKTVFLCYMNILSGLCFVVSALELVLVTFRKFWRKYKLSNRNFHRNSSGRGQRYEPLFFRPSPTAPAKNFNDIEHYYTSLRVPVRINNRNERPDCHVTTKGREVLDDETKEEKENFSNA